MGARIAGHAQGPLRLVAAQVRVPPHKDSELRILLLHPDAADRAILQPPPSHPRRRGLMSVDQ